MTFLEMDIHDKAMYADAYDIVLQEILANTNEYTNIAKLYTSLANKQLHFEQPETFAQKYPINNESYVTVTRQIAQVWDKTIEEKRMVSFGVPHNVALKICRNVANMHGKVFNLDTFASQKSELHEEEGEIEESVVLMLQSLETNTYLFPISSYVAVIFV